MGYKLSEKGVAKINDLIGRIWEWIKSLAPWGK